MVVAKKQNRNEILLFEFAFGCATLSQSNVKDRAKEFICLYDQMTLPEFPTYREISPIPTYLRMIIECHIPEEIKIYAVKVFQQIQRAALSLLIRTRRGVSDIDPEETTDKGIICIRLGFFLTQYFRKPDDSSLKDGLVQTWKQLGGTDKSMKLWLNKFNRAELYTHILTELKRKYPDAKPKQKRQRGQIAGKLTKREQEVFVLKAIDKLEKDGDKISARTLAASGYCLSLSKSTIANTTAYQDYLHKNEARKEERHEKLMNGKKRHLTPLRQRTNKED